MQQADAAVALADRVVSENLTLEAVRSLVRGYARPNQRTASARDAIHKRRGAATSVQDITSERQTSVASAGNESRPAVETAAIELTGKPVVSPARSSADPTLFQRPPRQPGERITPFEAPHTTVDRLAHLEGAVAALTDLAEHADDIAGQPAAMRAIHQAEQALFVLRRALLERTLSGAAWLRQRAYRLIDAELGKVLVLLCSQRAISVRIRPYEGRSTDLQLLLCLFPVDGSGDRQHQSRVERLFVAVLGGSQGLLHLQEGVSLDQIRSTFRLPRNQAAILGAFISDLVRAYVEMDTSAIVPDVGDRR